jgi:hypothetical protein
MAMTAVAQAPPPPPTLQAARARLPQARAASAGTAASPRARAAATAPARSKPSTRPKRSRGSAPSRTRPAAARKRTPATAAKKAAARRARATARPASRRRSQATPPRGQLIPIAVGRTAVAVRHLPDSGLVVRMTRGRMWIGVLGALLAGIVTLNVISLGLSSSSSRVMQQATTLEQANSALKARVAEQLSNDRVEAAAARLGLVVPPPGDISYLTLGSGDARLAAQRFAGGGFSGPTTLVSSQPAPAALAPTQPVSSPAPSPAPSTAPSQPAPAQPPAQPATGPAGGGGGTSGSGGGAAAGGVAPG